MRNYCTTKSNYGFLNPWFNDLFMDEKSFSDVMMRTDIKDNESHYEMKVDLPDVKKEDIKIELNNSYLTITAEIKDDQENNETKDHFIRRERRYGTFSRSFYFGDKIREEDINAKLENGVLTLIINKNKEEEKAHFISIE